MICRCVTAVGAVLKIYISQGSVATRFRCGGIFNGSFIANFLQIVAVKEFLKSVNIWRRYELEYGVSLFFDSRCIITFSQQFHIDSSLLSIS